MDDKTNSDTNNNEALRLANHSANTAPAPSTSSVVRLLNNVDELATENGARGDASPAHDGPEALKSAVGGRTPTDVDGDDRQHPQQQPHDERSTPPAQDGSTETAGTSQKVHSRVNRCNICGKKCSKPSDFKRHLVYHLSRKPFKCNDCGKRFQVKSNMLLHQRAAHADRYNHEFIEYPPGVRSNQSDMPVLCPEIYNTEHIGAGLGTVTKNNSQNTEQLKRNTGNGETGKSENSPGSNKGNSQEGNGSSPHSASSRGSGEGDGVIGDEEDYSIDYPSVFPGLKHQLSVKNETVLVTRLDGINKTTRERLSLYKCHMCGKIFNLLSRLQCHLSLHFERTLNVFVCTYCDAHFQFKTQLAQHLVRSHDIRVSSRDDILDVSELSPAMEQLQASPSDSQEGKDADEMHASYSGYPSGSANYVATGDSKNSGSSAISGTASSWPPTDCGSTDADNNMQYSMSARALYSRVDGLYVCQFCNKGFERLFSLSRHERVHTGFKPCYCKYCGRGFSEPRNLRHHIVRFHADGADAASQVIRRIRKGMPIGGPWRVNRRVSHSSQRLAYVPPEMVTKHGASDDADDDSQSFTALTKDLVSPSAPEKSEKDTTSPPPSSAQTDADMHQPIIIEPKCDASAEKELANEIREKEKLDEDVMVVIPSDAPLNDAKDVDMTAPKSPCSENMNWSESCSPNSSEIVSAPIKTLMSHHQPSRPRRKMSFTATGGGGGENTAPPAPAPPPDEQDIKPKMEPASDLATSSSLSCTPFASPDNPLASVSTPLSLPFNPLNISTYMAPGLGGLLPSPLISPLNQAFFAQQGLASPSVVHNPLSFFSPLPNPTSLIPTPTTSTGTGAGQLNTAKDTPPIDHSSSSSQHAHSPSETDASTPRCSLDDLQSWMAKGGGRGSALSRSQSSRLYVVRQPVKREEACKPIVLPDGRTVYRCTYCNKDFCTFSDVNRHMDFHEGLCKDIRPYKCKYCDYYARTNSQLKVHMMRHQGIREFHCKLCNYKGVTQSDLNRHMKSQIHMMKSQNACKHCGEGFVSPKNLERHYHEKHFSQYEQMASSHAAAHAAKLG